MLKRRERGVALSMYRRKANEIFFWCSALVISEDRWKAGIGNALQATQGDEVFDEAASSLFFVNIDIRG